MLRLAVLLIVALLCHSLVEFLCSSIIVHCYDRWLSFTILSHGYLISSLMILIMSGSLPSRIFSRSLSSLCISLWEIVPSPRRLIRLRESCLPSWRSLWEVVSSGIHALGFPSSLAILLPHPRSYSWIFLHHKGSFSWGPTSFRGLPSYECLKNYGSDLELGNFLIPKYLP